MPVGGFLRRLVLAILSFKATISSPKGRQTTKGTLLSPANVVCLKNMNWQEYIVSDKEVQLGKPTIRGTRISVEHLVGLLAQGWKEKDILDNFPQLSRESIQAVFAYLEDCLKDGLMFTPSKKSA